MNFLSLIFFILTFFIGLGISPSNAQKILILGPKETKIAGSIPYSVIGQYKARFGSFKGRIILDDNLQRVWSVYLEIEANSIHSNCPWCDKIARSRRLLYTARYPKIIFKSDEIIQGKKGYQVKGILEMHGVKRAMTFPFKVATGIDQKTKEKMLDLEGSWAINRKDFQIIWSKYLDHGGIVVGDDFTVDWVIRASIYD